LNVNALPITKRDSVITECVRENLVTTHNMTKLLESFVDGNSDLVLSQLLQFMTVRPKTGQGASTIVWIPFHMEEILKRFASGSNPHYLSSDLKNTMSVIAKLFNQFHQAKEQSGDAWECLFLIVLLIRVATGSFEEKPIVFPLNWKRNEYSFSYNSYGNIGNPNGNDLNEFLLSMAKPETFPHIAVYYPKHAQFPVYDVIVAIYDANRQQILNGYQLKEGKKCSDAEPDTKFLSSFLIRGLPPQRKMALKNDWISISDKEMEPFFGDSGKRWTPKLWAELASNKS